MGIKDKINRAFTAGKVNNLPKIMEQCPDKHPVKAPRKRMSDRTVSLISSVLTIAILVGTVFGGVVYFRNAFPDGIIHYDEPTIGPGLSAGNPSSPNPQVPVDTAPDRDPDGTELVPVDPLPTTDYPNTEEGYLIRTEDILHPYRDTIYYVPDAPVEYVVEYGIQKCRIVRSENGYCIQFDFDIITGYLLSIDILDCECEKTGILSPYTACWIAYMDAAPEYYGGTYDVQYNYAANGDGTYYIDIFEPVSCAYLIDNTTGEILDRIFIDTEEYITATQARDNALQMTGTDISAVRALKIEENGDIYTIYYECGKYSYNIDVSAIDGSIVYDYGVQNIGSAKWEALSLPVSWEKARDLALSACGRTIFDLLDFTIDCNGEVYWLEMRFEDDYFSLCIDANTGAAIPQYPVPPEVLPPEGCIDEKMALEYAVAQCNLQEKYAAGAFTEIACKLDTREDPPVYWVYFTVYRTMSYEVCINAYTGQMLSFQDYESDTIVTEQQAIDAARAYAYTNGELMHCVYLSTGNNQSFYLVSFHNTGSVVHVMVDASTLRCMDAFVEFPADAITKKEVVYKVCEYLGVEELQSSYITLQGIYNDGTPYYCVILHKKEDDRILLVDGFTGNITADLSTTEVTNP